MFPLLPALITCLAILMYLWLTFQVGRMRVRHKIKAPATHGHPDFERSLRVQMNTVEQMVAFLPLLWIFSLQVSPLWGASIGLVWVMGRILYAIGYYRDEGKRTPGFLISFLATVVLLIGSLASIICALMSHHLITV